MHNRNIISQIRPNRSQKYSYNQDISVNSIPTNLQQFKKLSEAIRGRSLTTALEILESELSLSGDLALLFLRKFQECGYSFNGGEADA